MTGASTTSADPIRRVLFVVTRQIGDVLLTTPLIHAARQRWPDAHIAVLGFAGTLGLVRGNPEIDEWIEMPVAGWGGWPLLRRIWRRYDIAFAADVGDRAHLTAWLAARTRSGIVPESNPSNWWKRRLLDHVVVAAGDRGDKHTALEKMELIAPWAGVPAQPQMQPPAERKLPDAIAAQLRDGFIVVHAPSMWSYKQWPLSHFESLVRELLARGRQVVLTGSGSTRDRQCIAPLAALAAPPQVLDVSGQLDFDQLAALLRRAALYIGPDTSVSHLAAGIGVPVIAIFGPTNPMRWGPLPAGSVREARYMRVAPVQRAGNVTLLQASLPCVPCGRAGCEDHRESRSDCLQAITPDRVLAEVLRIVGGS